MSEDQFINIHRRLDELSEALRKVADLATQMSVFQVKQDQHTQKIDHLEKALVTLKSEFLIETKKIEDRFLDLDKDKKAAIDRVHKRIDEVETDMETYRDKGMAAIKAVDDHNDEFQSDVTSKIAFVRGVIWVLGIVLIVAQGIAVKTYTDMETAIKAATEESTKINNRLHEMDRQFDSILNSINSIRDRK